MTHPYTVHSFNAWKLSGVFAVVFENALYLLINIQIWSEAHKTKGLQANKYIEYLIIVKAIVSYFFLLSNLSHVAESNRGRRL